jgi:hypothetical protein
VAGKIRRQSPAKTKTKATELFEGAAMSARTFRLLIVLNGRFYECHRTAAVNRRLASASSGVAQIKAHVFAAERIHGDDTTNTS